MRNIAIVMSLVALAFTMTSCTQGCKTADSKKPAANEKDSLGKVDNAKEAEPVKAEKPAGENVNGDKEKMMSEWKLQPGQKLFAVINTNLGTIKAELFWEKVPSTVRNFAELATGKKEWINPKTNAKEMSPLYNNTTFHRVIKGFMIQGGDPTGTGMGGPGYRFKDEFDASLKHDRAGILSMANAGPNTNGSQFFITEGPTPHLDNRHSVFGAVTEGLEVVNKIASVPTGGQNKPQNDVVINNISIING